MKVLKDLDNGHPFYSKDADKEWEQKRKRLEQEEKDLVKENRRRYRERNKKEEVVDDES